jgi:hypothetical protein
MEQVKESPETHQRLADWKTQLDQARQELNGWREKLGSRAAGLRKTEQLAEVEHFQNQFICQKEVADKLYHDLKRASKGASSEDGTPLERDALGERMETFRSLFEALRVDFDKFILKLSA